MKNITVTALLIVSFTATISGCVIPKIPDGVKRIKHVEIRNSVVGKCVRISSDECEIYEPMTDSSGIGNVTLYKNGQKVTNRPGNDRYSISVAKDSSLLTHYELCTFRSDGPKNEYGLAVSEDCYAIYKDESQNVWRRYNISDTPYILSFVNPNKIYVSSSSSYKDKVNSYVLGSSNNLDQNTNIQNQHSSTNGEGECIALGYKPVQNPSEDDLRYCTTSEGIGECSSVYDTSKPSASGYGNTISEAKADLRRICPDCISSEVLAKEIGMDSATAAILAPQCHKY